MSAAKKACSIFASIAIGLSCFPAQGWAIENNGMYQVAISLQAQTEEGEDILLDEHLISETELTISPDETVLTLQVAGEPLLFENQEGEFDSGYVVKTEETAEETVTYYEVPIADIDDRLAAQAQVLDEEDFVIYLALVVDDETRNYLEGLAAEPPAEEATEEVVEEVTEEATEETIEEGDLQASYATARVNDSALLSSVMTPVADTVTADDSQNENRESAFTLTAASLTPAVLSTTAPLTTVAASVPEDGEYTINLKVLDPDSDSEHTLAGDVINPATIMVSNGTIELYFSSYGREFTFQNSSGGFDNKTVYKDPGGNDIRSDGMVMDARNDYVVSVASLDETIVAKFPAGGSANGWLTLRILFDKDSLTLVRSGSEAAATTDSPSSDSSSSGSATGGSVKTGDESSLVTNICVLAASGITGAYLMASRRREQDPKLNAKV